MKKTLVLYARICPTESQHTIRIFEMFKKLEGITAVKIDGSKPFDHVKEQEFIKQFDNVILLFTMNWFNVPWSMSRYFAEVWRVGNFNLEGKHMYNVVTTGGSAQSYSREGTGWTASEYLNNVHNVFKKLKAIGEKDYFYHSAIEFDEKRLNESMDHLKEEYLNKISK